MKAYPATTAGWVPVEQRQVERFTLGARPPMDPDKSEKRLRKALGAADDTPGPRASDALTGPDPKRGLFGRRR